MSGTAVSPRDPGENPVLFPGSSQPRAPGWVGTWKGCLSLPGVREGYPMGHSLRESGGQIGKNTPQVPTLPGGEAALCGRELGQGTVAGLQSRTEVLRKGGAVLPLPPHALVSVMLKNVVLLGR